jgi:hypothetical protein
LSEKLEEFFLLLRFCFHPAGRFAPMCLRIASSSFLNVAVLRMRLAAAVDGYGLDRLLATGRRPGGGARRPPHHSITMKKSVAGRRHWLSLADEKSRLRSIYLKNQYSFIFFQ